MNKKNELNKELDKISPVLSGVKKENAFRVPKNYFSTLPDEVLEKIMDSSTTSKQKSGQTIWFNHFLEKIAMVFRLKYAVGFATAIVTIIAAVYFFQSPNDPVDDDYQLLSEYVSDNIDEFDVEMLWEVNNSQSGIGTENDSLNEKYPENLLEEIIDDLDDSELEMLLL